MTKVAEQYKSCVKHSLFCGRADRNHLLDRLTEMLDDFQQARPEADYAEYAATFGEPPACAAELLSSLGESKIEAARKKHSLRRRAAFAGIVAVLICISFFWFIKYHESLTYNGQVTIIEGPAFDLTEEEYNNAKKWALESLQSQEGE